MPKTNRVTDALVITSENDRIVELWFRARASVQLCEQHSSSDFLFVASIGGKEERKGLAGALDFAERVPEMINVCLLREKMVVSLPFLEQFANALHTVQMYVHAPQEEVVDGVSVIPPKAVKPPGKKDRGKREENLFAVEEAEQIFSTTFDLIDLLTLSSVQHFVPMPSSSMLQDCVIEIRSGTPFLPIAKLNKYRPLKIEVHSICNLPRDIVLCGTVFVRVKFGGVELQSPDFDVAENAKIGFRRVVFLGTRTPLDVYQDVFFRRMEVSVFKEQKVCLGTGAVSLRAAVTDRQTTFSEMVDLLPSRGTFSRNDSCLTSGTAVSLRVDFFEPFPSPIHVLSDGSPAHGHFLTRGIIRMPYTAKWVPGVIEALIAALLQIKKANAGNKLYQYEVPPPEPEAPSVKEKKKETGKFQKTNAALLTPSPSPSAGFDAPLKIVSPPGISGFEVMDDDIRIICIEGLAVEVRQVLERVEAAASHNPQLELLMNAELFVPARAYTVFPPLVTIPKIASTLDLITEIVEKGGKSFSEGPTQKNIQGFASNLGEAASGATAVDHTESSLIPSKGEAEETGDAFDAAEAEADGTGGRIHRIRIRETIKSFLSVQRYFLRRMVSESCISCYSKLHAITQCNSLRTVLERDLFPTAEELIALERSFGLTLELYDVFGKQQFVNVTVEKVPTSFLKSPDEETRSDQSSAVILNALEWKDIGKIVLFEAIKIMSSKRCIPTCVQQRYPDACWMRTTDTNMSLLCVFPAGCQPSGTIRYLIESQVVQCGEMLCLYALRCDSLAKSYTHSRNPAYEEHLRTTRRLKLYFSSKDREQKVSDSTMNTIRAGGTQTENGNSSNDDASADPPPSEKATVLHPVTAVSQDRMNYSRRNITTQRKNLIKPTTADYELCWELYRQRSRPAPPEPPKGPPMRF